MSEQLKRDDRKFVQESENRFHIYRFDGEKWQYRHVCDKEGAVNYMEGMGGRRIGTDTAGNPIFRPTK